MDRFQSTIDTAWSINSGFMGSRGFFGRLGWFLAGFRYVVVLFWAGIALAAHLYLPPLEGNTTGSLSDLVPESAPAAQAEQSQLGSDLAGPVEPPAILVYSNPQGFTRADLR
ncbi:hypothetical protein BH24ACT21_BH24ACT21_12170 [soil metagenome]